MTLMEDLIWHACMAGIYGETVRRLPATAEGFSVLRERHSRRVQQLADEVAALARASKGVG